MERQTCEEIDRTKSAGVGDAGCGGGAAGDKPPC